MVMRTMLPTALALSSFMKQTSFLILIVLHQVLYTTAHFKSSAPHECLRTCEWPPEPMICRYEFTLEWFHTMSTACFECPFNQTDCYRPHCIPANGAPRAITVVNRQFPGPSIQVCESDTIEVKVENNLVGGEGVTIHWHGLHQRGTPHMDGVPLITQCPIPFRSSFTYKFKAEMAGTYFWHSHLLQRADGAAGSLIIRQAVSEDVHSGSYDYDLPEHVIMVQDWLNQPYVDRYARIAFHDIAKVPDSLLVNGEGRYKKFTSTNSNKSTFTPRHVFFVKKGARYRFRTISNSVMACAFEVSIDAHNLTVIASDGASVEPLSVGAFAISSGERYDFVLDATADIGKYWMRVKGRDACRNMYELALVTYEGATDYPDPPDKKQFDFIGARLNPYNVKAVVNHEYASVLNADELNATGNDNGRGIIAEANVVHYVGIDMPLVNTDYYTHPAHSFALEDGGRWPATTGLFSAQINHISFKMPRSPLLTQSREISELEMCIFEKDTAKVERCKKEYCECTHVLEVKLGKVVELVIINEAQRNFNAHPMHLHGYRFQVLALDKVGTATTVDEVMRLDKAGNISRRTVRAPYKDTVSVPDGGYVVVRFVADNPGWWMFHCHTEIHLSAGMSMVIHVGSDDDLPPIPNDLPRCGGDWHPADV